MSDDATVLDPQIEELVTKFVRNPDPRVQTLTLVITKKANGRLRVEARESSSHNSHLVSGRTKRPRRISDETEGLGAREEDEETASDTVVVDARGKNSNNNLMMERGSGGGKSAQDNSLSVPSRSATSSAASRAKELRESQMRRPSGYALAEHRRLALALYLRKLVAEDGTPMFTTLAEVESLKSRGIVEAIRKEVGTRSLHQIEEFLRGMTIEQKMDSHRRLSHVSSFSRSSPPPLDSEARGITGLTREDSGMHATGEGNVRRNDDDDDGDNDDGGGGRTPRKWASRQPGLNGGGKNSSKKAVSPNGGFSRIGCGLDLVQNDGRNPPKSVHAVVASYDPGSGRHLLIFDDGGFVWAVVDHDASLKWREQRGEVRVPEVTSEMLDAIRDFVTTSPGGGVDSEWIKNDIF